MNINNQSQGTPTTFSCTFNELNITSEMAERVMGYTDASDVPEPVVESIKEILGMAEELYAIRGGYNIIDPLLIDKEKRQIFSHDYWFKTGQIVTHQLRRSEMGAWFVCTAGEEVSSYSRRLMDEGDLIKGYVVDVLSNIAVDSAMDLIQAHLKDTMARIGLKITNRYSPGYCNWDIIEQKQLFKAFPDNFLGISLSESCLMIPVKSISGIIGIGKDVRYNEYTCNLCDDKQCLYRNRKAV